MLSTERSTDGRVVLTVSDRGMGIAPDDLPRIFDPFFTTRRAGTGLGLPIAKNIIDGLGGTISIAATPGEGTTIAIELGDAPRARA
jgi:two-component system, NtrC family, sensor kinase